NPIGWTLSNTYVWIGIALPIALPIRRAAQAAASGPSLASDAVNANTAVGPAPAAAGVAAAVGPTPVAARGPDGTARGGSAGGGTVQDREVTAVGGDGAAARRTSVLD